MAVSTTVKITNNIGETANCTVQHHDYYGHIIGTYPKHIQDGQTIEFVFGSENGVSSGAVVYQGKNKDWLYAWYNNNYQTYKAYTAIAEAKHAWNWDTVQASLMNSGTSSHAESESCVSDAGMSQQPYQGVMSLKGGSTS